MFEETMLPQFLPMVGRDDHEGSLEHPAPSQCIEELTEPVVQVRETLVVGVAKHLLVRRGQSQLVRRPPVSKRRMKSAGVRGFTPKRTPTPSGGR